MSALLFAFLGVSSLLWLTSFGFLALLLIVTWSRRRAAPKREDWPDVALVVPTLNEEAFIHQKLDDVRKTDYPAGRLRILVVDGGSSDRTRDLVQRRIDEGQAIQLVCLTGIKNKIEQVVRSLELLGEEFVVFTDADTRLEPDCVKELIGSLLLDPRAAIIGATVRPASGLLEEIIHWRLHNFLWWLEGEAFFAAGFSGVCYALRKDSAGQFCSDVQAEDIHLSLSVCAGGHRARICPSAVAHEMRVPQTVREFFRFRHRRGSRYVAALRRFQYRGSTPVGWRLVRQTRLWQFSVAPWVGFATAGLATAFLFTPQRAYSAGVSIAFLLPALGGLLYLNRETGRDAGWGKLIFALIRYSVLIMISLLTLDKVSASETGCNAQP